MALMKVVEGWNSCHKEYASVSCLRGPPNGNVGH